MSSVTKIIIWHEINKQLTIQLRHIQTGGPFHKSSYERFLLYEFVKPVLNYRSNEFVALTNLCETRPGCAKVNATHEHISIHLSNRINICIIDVKVLHDVKESTCIS